MTEEGEKDYEFVEKLLPKYKCAICLSCLKRPVQVVTCGHRFCKVCFEKWKSDRLVINEKLTCPEDRTPIDQREVFPDTAFAREIQGLVIKCTNNQYGCRWENERRNLNNHLQKECLWETTECQNVGCKKVFLRKDLTNHQQEECEYRTYICFYCENCYMVKDEEKHRDECFKFPLECENKCGEINIERAKIAKHLKECPLAILPCLHEDKGCQFQGKKQEMNDHMKLHSAFSEVMRHVAENGREIDYKKEIFIAVEQEDIANVRKLMDELAWNKKKAVINSRNVNGDTPLVLASAKGRTDIASILINNGAFKELTDTDGNTPLMLASANGHTSVAFMLINHKVMINTLNKNGDNALMLALKNGHKDIVLELNQHDAEKNIINNCGNTPLTFATSKGYSDIVLPLLNKNALVDIRDGRNETSLMKASAKGYKDLMQILLNYGASVDKRNSDGNTPLILAASNGHNIQVLLENMAEINIQNNEGDTPLTLALANGCNDNTISKKLLDWPGTEFCTLCDDLHTNACARKSNQYDECPLLIASIHGNTEMVRKLYLDHNVRLDVPDNKGNTPLICAAMNGHEKTVHLLLFYGALVNWQNFETDTALILASQYGHYKIVQALIKSNASIDKMNSITEQTALYNAASEGHLKTVLTLVYNGASINVQNIRGDTALSIASFFGHDDVVKSLLQHDANSHIINDHGYDAYEVATEMTRESTKQILYDWNYSSYIDYNNPSGKALSEVMEECEDFVYEKANKRSYSIKKGLDEEVPVDVRDEEGNTPLIRAAMNGQYDIVRRLLRDGASVEWENNEGDTSLTLACQYGHKKTVEELLFNGASVDKANNNIGTPLHIAASEGHLEIVKTLLKNGASLNEQNVIGDTPLMTACYFGHKQIVVTLLIHNSNSHVFNDLGYDAYMAAALRENEDIKQILYDWNNYGMIPEYDNNDD